MTLSRWRHGFEPRWGCHLKGQVRGAVEVRTRDPVPQECQRNVRCPKTSWSPLDGRAFQVVASSCRRGALSNRPNRTHRCLNHQHLDPGGQRVLDCGRQVGQGTVGTLRSTRLLSVLPRLAMCLSETSTMG